jgi:hypothetical protein
MEEEGMLRRPQMN